MKNNKGITLIALSVTIIVLIILASVGTYTGTHSIRDAKESSQLAELGIVQQSVLENYVKYKNTGNKVYIIGTAISYEDVTSLLTTMSETPKISAYTLNAEERSPFYYYRLSNKNLKDMGITQSKENSHTYIVNYITGEVINETVEVTSSGKGLYVYANDYR